MSDNDKSGFRPTGGIGFCGLLTILFIGLKLTGYINWSWWWVLAPTWIPLAIGAVVILGLLLLWLVAQVAIALLERKS